MSPAKTQLKDATLTKQEKKITHDQAQERWNSWFTKTESIFQQ